MPDYSLYLDSAGITRKQAIDTLHSHFPKFGKSVMTAVCNPENYGSMLLPEAERVLVDAYGWHTGLATRRRRKDIRKKKNRITLRLDDSIYTQVQELFQRSAFASMQDMIEAAVVEFLNRRLV